MPFAWRKAALSSGTALVRRGLRTHWRDATTGAVLTSTHQGCEALVAVLIGVVIDRAVAQLAALSGRTHRLVNGVETETKYRVRDRSAIAVRYSFHDTYYFCCAQPGTGRNEDSEAHRVYGGYVGQIGKKILLDVMAGYGWGLYKQDSNGPNHKNFIGYAALGYFPTPRTQLTLRIGRDFHDSIFGNYFSDVGGNAAFTHVFNWNMRIDAGIGVWRRRYAGLPIPGQDTPDIVSYTAAEGFVRQDTLISANLQVEQSFGRIWVIGARYSLAADLTDFATEYSNGFVSPSQFARNLVLVFAAVRY